METVAGPVLGRAGPRRLSREWILLGATSQRPQNTKVLDNEEMKRICGFSKTTAMNGNYHHRVTEMFVELETTGREDTE